jgi:hypothetical protein
VQELAADAGLVATRVAFADLSTSGLSSKLDARSSKYLDQGEPEFDLGGPSAAEAPLVHNNKRLHSFSAPKRTEVIDDEASTSPSTLSEELDYLPDEAAAGSNPRYLRETLASINSRPRRLSSTGPIRSSTTSKRVSLPANQTGRSYSSGAILGTRESKAPSAASKGVAKKAGKAATAPSSRAASTTASGRVFFSVDFPPPQASTASLSSRSRGGHILTGSTRRSVVDPLSQQPQSSAPLRPRTAPPRGRKDVEIKDLLQSKKVDLGGFSRITIDPKPAYRAHASVDYTTAAGIEAPMSSATRGVRRASTSTGTGYGRAKTARASWR